MDIKKQFEYNPAPELTAAQIGINKWDWETISLEDENQAKRIMSEHKYDVLPIKEKENKFTNCYTTEKWNNYEHLNLAKIDDSNSIYYNTSFTDLIHKFNTEKTHFYFLVNSKEVLGLVSYVNINCQIVNYYLYQIISDIELSISNILRNNIAQIEIISLFKQSNDSHIKKILAHFEKSTEQGHDNSIFEYMYLQTIGITLREFITKLPKQYLALNKYTEKFGPNQDYSEIRNKVMHPVRSILNDSETISKIDRLLTDYSEIKKIIQPTSTSNPRT